MEVSTHEANVEDQASELVVVAKVPLGAEAIPMTLWPCNICDQPGVRNVGTEGKCARHLNDLYKTFNPAVFKLQGIGLPGASTDDTLLTCAACQATWHGPAGEPCYYCNRSRRIQLEHQAELVLDPPDTNPDDTNYETRMFAWVDRLKTAVEAGIITDKQAHTAITREERRHVAA